MATPLVSRNTLRLLGIPMARATILSPDAMATLTKANQIIAALRGTVEQDSDEDIELGGIEARLTEILERGPTFALEPIQED